MEQGFSDLEIHFYRADCHFKMGFLNKALSTLEKVGSENYKKISYFILKSSIYHKMGQRTMAWKTLNQAKKLNKNLIFIVKKQFSFLIEEKLYLSAYDSLKPYVRRKHFVDDIVKMSVLLRKEKQYQYAVQLLESLRIHWPKRQEIALELTQNYLKMKMNY